MLKLGMLPHNFPMVDTHCCQAMVEEGRFLIKCSEDTVYEARVTSVTACKARKKEEEGTDQEKEVEDSVSFPVGSTKGQAVNFFGLPFGVASCKPGLTLDNKGSSKDKFFKEAKQ